MHSVRVTRTVVFEADMPAVVESNHAPCSMLVAHLGQDKTSDAKCWVTKHWQQCLHNVVIMAEGHA